MAQHIEFPHAAFIAAGSGTRWITDTSSGAGGLFSPATSSTQAFVAPLAVPPGGINSTELVGWFHRNSSGDTASLALEEINSSGSVSEIVRITADTTGWQYVAKDFTQALTTQKAHRLRLRLFSELGGIHAGFLTATMRYST